jgi:uncharacterized membrane protein YoaK (UPF0700 family)
VFNHEGPSRSPQKNAVLAAYLAFTAGFVNSGGFVLVGFFTSHVTGSVGRIGTDIAADAPGAAGFAALLVAMFFLGSFGASLILELKVERVSRAYAAVLLVEATLLAGFAALAAEVHTTNARVLDAEASLLCLAMGMQNSMVTRLSGAVVRTTHLTGVITDLGIEVARSYQWRRWRHEQHKALPRTSRPPARRAPIAARAVLLLIIAVSFLAGGVLGAVSTARVSHWAMLIPSLLILAASAYALFDAEAPARIPSQ